MLRDRLLALLAFGAAIALIYGYWWEIGRPRAVVDAPAGRLDCVSYTPFRDSESPFDPTLVVPPARIEADLIALKPVSNCVRLYATDQGLAAVPEIANRLGMRVLLGIWIGGEPPKNRLQVDQTIRLANAYPDAVSAIIVGNEVLLRGEQTPETLAALMAEVRAATGKPVTYADVWEFWLRAPQVLADAADFITIHVLPYWEDHPVAAIDGVPHLEAVLREVEAKFGPKPILLGETGWPSAGRERDGAIPGRLEQARYLREFLVYAQARGLDYNLIEAFDQPWKRQLEGTVGGHWGILDGDRQPKLPLRGPVSDDPAWRLKVFASGGIALLLLASLAPALRRARGWRLVTAAPMAVGAGALLVLQAAHSALAVRSPGEAAVELFLFAATSLTAWELLRRLLCAERDAPVAVADLTAALPRFGWMLRDPAARLTLLQLVAVAGALSVNLALLFDPRYRDFPIAAFALPAVGFALRAVGRRDVLQAAADRREEAVFAGMLAASAVIVAFREGPDNRAALSFAAVSLLLAMPWLGAWRKIARAAPAALTAATG